MPARQARAERGAYSLGLVPPHLVVTLTTSVRGPLCHAKGSSRGVRGTGSSHSISIGDGAIGPPRIGFILRLCIRKADEDWGEAAPVYGLAAAGFSRKPAGPSWSGPETRADRSLARRERLGGEGQVQEQGLEIGPVTQGVEVGVVRRAARLR